MFRKTLLLLLLCACAAADGAKVTKKSNDSILRAFSLFNDDATDEPIDFRKHLIGGEASTRFPNTTTEHGRGRGQHVSEVALTFLSGPVSTVLIPSFYTLVCLVSVPINIGAVLAFTHAIRPKKPAAIYMLNLACADLFFAAVLPFKIFYHFAGNNWVFGPIMCRVVTAAFYWNMYCSVLLIACISVDRLLAVVYPIDSLAWRRPRNAVVACVTMWAVSLAGSLPLVLPEQTAYVPQLDVTTCHDVQPVVENVGRLRIYFVTLSCALFFLPLLVTLVSYTRVIWSLSRVPRGVPGRSRRRTRAIVMALTVLVIFLLCFTPTNCALLAHYLQFNGKVDNAQEAPDGSYGLYLVFLCLGSLNCLLDPLVYYFGSSQCQRQLSSALRCRKYDISGISSSGGGGNSHSSSNSCRSSSRAMMKPSITERTNTSVTDVDSLQKNLSSQYKKLLV